MASFLTTTGTTWEVEKIINTAENTIVLISPFIKISDRLLQNLRAADQKGVKTKIVYGKKRQLDAGVEMQLQGLDNVELLFLENLHAKCYFNERSMVITSMNLYDFSEQNNREMGVLMTRADDGALFEAARSEAEMIIGQASSPTAAAPKKGAVTERTGRLQKPAEERPKRGWAKPLSNILSGILGTESGYCIRCGEKSIPYDVDTPYCKGCYRKWSKYKNPAYEEKYCHSCGKKRRRITKTKPRCSACYST